MTPRITLLFASLHALLMLALAARVAFHRHSQKVGLGDGGDKRLMRKIRVHANFVEYVPIALLLLALLELSDLPEIWLWSLGGGLLLARVLHVIGLSQRSGYSFGRFWGTLLTWVVLVVMAAAGLWLSITVL
jgi:uncharacterized protein